MATNNINTQSTPTTSALAYQLKPAEAEKLRVPRIQYPNGIVPRKVIEACLLDGSLSKERYPELAGDMHIDDLLALLDRHYRKEGVQ